MLTYINKINYTYTQALPWDIPVYKDASSFLTNENKKNNLSIWVEYLNGETHKWKGRNVSREAAIQLVDNWADIPNENGSKSVDGHSVYLAEITGTTNSNTTSQDILHLWDLDKPQQISTQTPDGTNNNPATEAMPQSIQES